ncbi:MAG: hypothetical protein AAGG07_03575 [Planctomycetota bacterium]
MKPSTRLITVSLALAALLPAMHGCAVGALVGGMAESYNRTRTKTIPAQYIGLEGKSYAVVIAADRIIQAEFPNLTAVLTDRINTRLATFAGASGFIPTQTTLAYLLNRPSWVSMPLGELADELGVDRLVYIDLYEFRLHAPGNSYLWDGVAAGTVAIIEADGYAPDEFAFEREITMKFPDTDGYGPGDLDRNLVSSVLVARFVDRSSWLFYEHEEPYYPDY